MVTLHSEAERILENWEQGKLPLSQPLNST